MKRYQTANRLFLASAILFGAAVILQHASPWSGSEAVSTFYFLPSPALSAAAPTGSPSKPSSGGASICRTSR